KRSWVCSFLGQAEEEESGTMRARDGLGDGAERAIRLAVKREAAVEDIIILKDISYYAAKDADPERNKLDLYLPKGRQDFPVLFWVHGGALRMGDRKNSQPLCETFAKQGIGVVTTGYRLSPAVKHPAHTEDVARAFAWAVLNITKHGGRADAIFVSGHSAGA